MSERARMTKEEFEERLAKADASTLVSVLTLTVITECARNTTLSAEQKGDIMNAALQAYRLMCLVDNTGFWLSALDKAPEIGEAFRPLFRGILVDCGHEGVDKLSAQIARVELLSSALDSATGSDAK